MALPLRVVTDGLRQLNSAEIERIAYNLRVAYATQLAKNGDGRIYVGGSGGTQIGTASNTERTVTSTTSRGRGDRGRQQHDWANIPSTTLGTRIRRGSVYTYRQDRDRPTSPTDATHLANGYLYVTGSNLRMTQSNVLNEILDEAETQLRTGDEVGSYRVRTINPGGGSWTNVIEFFKDTKYNNRQINSYRLWLKTANSTVPSSTTNVLGMSGTNMIELDTSPTSNLVQRILLPQFTRQLIDNNRVYTVISGSGGNRGTFIDTNYTTGTNSYTGPSRDIYTTFNTPSGGNVNVSTYSLNLG